MSTFHGLEMAKQALYAQQSALYTTGHNISNANTEGYTRQRVNFQTNTPFPSPGRNQPSIPGQVGTGVKTGSIQRIRDKFLDFQYRAEQSRAGYWDTKSQALSRMEALLNEPSDSGLSKTMNDFWDSLQDLALHPDSAGTRSVVAQRGIAVSQTFNHLSESLHAIRNDLRNQIDHTAEDANSLLRQIHSLNEQIKKVEPHGYLTNDLYDERDRLVDELSQMMNIRVSYEKSSESALDIADGLITIELVDSKGASLAGGPVYLMEGTKEYPEGHFDDVITIEYEPDNQNPDAVSAIKIKDFDQLDDLAFMDTIGSLRGLIESYGYMDNGEVQGEYPGMIEQLDQMAFEFINEFNRVHRLGYDLEGEPGEDFFENLTDVKDAAKNIAVRQEIVDNNKLIAASDEEDVQGNGRNALALAAVFDGKLTGLDGKSPRGFFEAIIGDLGVRAGEANRMKTNTEILRSQIDESRMSVSAVSIDEELVNLLKFQHAYNAAARSLTAIDEILEKIINGMGLVGR
ncbi:flagellar hook-associated protein FlgK [Ornithinibacillus sp. 4-3]|uniref:Flagellar hook-associated protein 1 n=1 Tax=Ornithinibacillus sp. 4-3 TaxID=3231488 RepID=A0AB39HQN4_9BACI